MDGFEVNTAKLNNEHSRRRKWQRFVSVLSAIAVFCTTYALILPAITWEYQLICELEEHEHTDSCYEEVVIPESKDLVCEIEEHAHGDSCYTIEEVLVCDLEESEEHQHDELCYEEVKILACEVEEHTHGDECYTVTPEYTEKKLICGHQEHKHTEACYDAPPDLETGYYCGQVSHTHNETCYLPDGTLHCTLPEHEHTPLCESNKDADVETKDIWEASIAGVELKSNYAKDVIAVAKSQVGYCESTENFTFDDENEKKGYSRYGAWYGSPYDDWCAMFCSFCLNYAEIDRELIPYEASCSRWVKLLKDEKLYFSSDRYTPKEGDLVFFDWDSFDPDHAKDRSADHVGFVADLIYDEESKELIKIKTIEGNSGDKVQYVTYDIDDGQIMGYGRLPEKQRDPLSDIMDRSLGKNVVLNASWGIYGVDDFFTAEVVNEIDNAELILQYTDDIGKTWTDVGAPVYHVEAGETVNMEDWYADYVTLDSTAQSAGIERVWRIISYSVDQFEEDEVPEEEPIPEEETVPEEELISEEEVVSEEAAPEDEKITEEVEASEDSKVLCAFDTKDILNACSPGFKAWLEESYIEDYGAERMPENIDELYQAYDEYTNLPSLTLTQEIIDDEMLVTAETDFEGDAQFVWEYFDENDEPVEFADTGADPILSASENYSVLDGGERDIQCSLYDVKGSLKATRKMMLGAIPPYNQVVTDPSQSSYTTGSDGMVRLYKSAVPYTDASGTPVENEFNVTLSIDIKDMMAEFFKKATYGATESANYHDSAPGEWVATMTGSEGVSVHGEQQTGTSYKGQYYMTIIDKDGKYGPAGSTVISHVPLWWTKASNFTSFIDFSKSAGLPANDHSLGYAVLTAKTKAGVDYQVPFDAEAMESLYKALSLFAFQSVDDQMGEYVEFLPQPTPYTQSSVSPYTVTNADYTYDSSSKTLTWIPSIDPRVPLDSSSWYNNVTNITYHVRLMTEKAGFDSSGENMANASADDSYDTNDHATLHYFKTKSADFPIPHVRGLLYNIEFTKIDEITREPIKDAVFKITGTPLPDGRSPITMGAGGDYCVATDENGVAKFENLVALDGKFNGVFTITEVEAPEGYMLPENPDTVVSISDYTLSPNNFVVDGENMLYGRAAGTEILIENRPNPRIQMVKEEAGTLVPLSDAEFAIYKVVNGVRADTPMDTFTSDTEGILTPEDYNLGLGTYVLVETKSPNGYEGFTSDITITVTRDDLTAVGSFFTLTKISADDEPDAYKLELFNNSGYELPNTGGIGTTSIYIVGTLLLMVSALLYGCVQRRKRERRTEY